MKYLWIEKKSLFVRMYGNKNKKFLITKFVVAVMLIILGAGQNKEIILKRIRRVVIPFLKIVQGKIGQRNYI